VGPGALVAAGDDGSSHAFPTSRPTRTILRATEISKAAPSEKEVVVLVAGIGSAATDGVFAAIGAAFAADPRYDVVRFGSDPAHPYDTHGSIEKNADQLTAAIRELAKTHSRVDIVAHSMGGAVVDAAFRRGLSAGDNVATYVALASPHDGSTEARIGRPFLTIADVFGARTELRAITAGVAQDIGSAAAQDLAVIHAGPPPIGVTRLDVRMATDLIVTAPDAWTPAVTSRTLLPSSAGSVEGHGGVTTDPRAIGLITATVATGSVPPLDERGAIVDLAARVVSTVLAQPAPVLYCALGVVALACAIALSVSRRRRPPLRLG
jgi:pimeloyl-ACP methyl ester carboxylesterase